MKKLCCVSHPRSGIHWVLDTIFRNFHTPYNEYWDIFGNHKLDINTLRKIKPTAIILHLSRDIQPALMSVFRMRERNGISIQLKFSDFLRTKYTDMPKTSKAKIDIFFDNKLTQQPTKSWIQNQPYTPPELWLMTNIYWRDLGITTITYEQMKEDQKNIFDIVGDITAWRRKKPVIITKTVGWHPPDNKVFDINNDDKQLMGEFRVKLSQGIIE